LRTANTGRKREFVPLPDLIAHLIKVRSRASHHFWFDDITFGDPQLFNIPGVHGRRQLTDVYLLGLAVKRDGRLVTFDSRIPLGAVKGARREHLHVLASVE